MSQRRVLLFATTTGYQIRSFADAAERLGVEVVFCTDRCMQLDDPWGDAAVPVRFHDEELSLTSVLKATSNAPVGGLLAVGDQPCIVAARVAQALNLPWHPPDAARRA